MAGLTKPELKALKDRLTADNRELRVTNEILRAENTRLKMVLRSVRHMLERATE